MQYLGSLYFKHDDCAYLCIFSFVCFHCSSKKHIKGPFINICREGSDANYGENSPHKAKNPSPPLSGPLYHENVDPFENMQCKLNLTGKYDV